MSLNKKPSMKKKKNQKQQVQNKKIWINFSHIKRLAFLKDTLQKLPEYSQYKIENEVDYLRHLSSVLPIIQSLRIDQLSFKKIAIQFVKQTQHKEIVLSVLSLLVKGVPDFAPVISKFMIQFQGLKVIAEKQQPIDKIQTKLLQKKTVSYCVTALVKKIAKWYYFDSLIQEKYGQLLDLIIKI